MMCADEKFPHHKAEEGNEDEQTDYEAKEESTVSGSIGSNDVTLERPLTPLSRCLQVGLPAETIQTAAAAFTKVSHGCDERLGEIVIMHAKVYCFAHQFLISSLENIALQRLTQLLLTCDTPSGPFFLRLAGAIRLVYDSTPRSKLNDPVRNLLSQHVALKYTTLSDDSLNTLIAEGGDFMIDVSHKLARRISTSGKSARSLEDNIDELEMNISRLDLEAQDQACLLKRIEEEIGEWRAGTEESRQSIGSEKDGSAIQICSYYSGSLV